MISLRRDVGFDELWKDLGECYRSLNIRCIAEKDGDTWRNLMVIGLLSRRSVDDMRKETEHDYSFLRSLKIGEIEKLGVFYDVAEAQYTPTYIGDMETGRITLANQPIYLREGYDRHSLYSDPRIIRFGEYREYPHINYEFYSRDSPIISEELRNRILSLGFLYGIDELSLQWLKISVTAFTINSIIVMPLYFNVIDSLVQSEGEFCIKYKAHKILRPKLKVLLALRKYQGENRYLTIENKFFNPEDISSHDVNEDFSICEARYTFKALPSLDDEVYFRMISELGVLSHERRIVKELMKRAEFKEEFLNFFTKFIDRDRLRDILQGKEYLSKSKIDPAIEFQRAISSLLSLMDFKNIELGDTRHGTIKRSDGSHVGDVDVIAQDVETKRMYAIQCTISPPDDRKIDVIANITSELRVRGVPVEPLIFVRDFATQVKKNVRRVRVIDLEDLLHVLKLLQEENIKEAKRMLIEYLP
ncbi:MAG: hypothetical protein QMD12_03370 [Candidatus Aenigmarchaeota archaeon]|nr:hypothetical protein [Candidatus Aenigmarchaeota archaeon]